MAAERIQTFRIEQYLIDPSKNLIAGPSTVSEVSPVLMSLLVQLAESPGHYTSSQRLLANADIDIPSGSSGLDILVQELLQHFEEVPEHPKLIIGSIEVGYKLCAEVDYVDASSLKKASDLHDGPDTKIDSIAHKLSKSTNIPTEPHADLTPPASESGWFEALKRRRVFRAMAAYAVASWLLMQITDLLAGAFPAVPPSATGYVTIGLAIGFPFAVLLAWLVQLTPSGLKWDIADDGQRGWFKEHLVHLIDVFVIVVLLVVVAFLSFDRFLSIQTEGVSVAVLAFTNSNAEQQDRYLGVGISDNIRTRLAGVDKLLVSAPPSRELQPGLDLSVQSIGKKLGVDYVLYGSVHRSNKRVQLDVHLVNVATGYSRWAQTYDAALDDMLKVNSDISLYVASKLKVLLTQELRQTLAGNPTDNPEAYEAYLEARSFLELPRSNNNLAKALFFSNLAIDADPTFALAYASRCEAFTAVYLDSADLRAIDLAEENCKTALRLDDQLSPVHVALGDLFRVSGRLPEAEQAFVSALALDENSLGAITGLGHVYEAQGNLMSAELQFDRAIDKLPTNWNGYNQLARFLFSRGRYSEAADNYRHVIAFTQNNVNAYSNLGAAFFYMGDFAHAAENYRRSLQLEPNEASYSNTGSMYYYNEDYPLSVAMFKKAVELSPKDYRVWGNLADAQRFIPNAFNECLASYAQAIKLAEAQLEISPDDIQIQSNLAYYFANIGDKKSAKTFLSVLKLTPILNPEYQYTMALTFRLIGDQERSSQALSEARVQGFPDVVIDATPEFRNSALIESFLHETELRSSENE